MKWLRSILRFLALLLVSWAIRVALTACLPDWETWGGWSEGLRAGASLLGGNAALRSKAALKIGGWIQGRVRLCQTLAKLGKGMKVGNLFEAGE